MNIYGVHDHGSWSRQNIVFIYFRSLNAGDLGMVYCVRVTNCVLCPGIYAAGMEVSLLGI